MLKRVILGLGIARIFLAGLLAGTLASGVLPAIASGNRPSASVAFPADSTGFATSLSTPA